MVEATADRRLSDLVIDAPGSARILEAFGLDYCCGGQQRLSDACGSQGIDPAAVLLALEGAPDELGQECAAMTPTELVDHIEATHHEYLKAELPRLDALVTKVSGVHGANHAELADVAAVFGEVRADLEPHLAKEEQVLFPMIRELDAATTAPSFHCGTLRNPISVMLNEHDRVGDLLARLRGLTDGHRVPDDGCASYRALCDGFAELERDTHMHIHKENNLLFPAVIQLESRLGRQRS